MVRIVDERRFAPTSPLTPGFAGGGSIDESMDALPFDPQMRFETKGAYEMTQNYMKNLDLIEANDNNKCPQDVKDFVKSRVGDRKPTVNLVRRILKQGGYRKHYPESVVILEFILGQPIEKSTPQQRAQHERMHQLYARAFSEIPPEIRRRKSSLTNNYLTAEFNMMLGLAHRNVFIHMLTGEKKLLEHNRLMKLIVDRVRATSEATNVANGTTFWVFYPISVD